MMLRIIFFIIILSCVSCDTVDKTTEYYDTGEIYKLIESHKNGEKTIQYFEKDGTKIGDGEIIGGIETKTLRYKSGQIYGVGNYDNDKRVGWHNFYHENGKKMSDVFFINNKDCQVKKYNDDESIDTKNSIYTEIHLTKDTLNQSEETLGFLRYLNSKSSYERIYVYLSNDIDKDFLNLNEVVVDTFMSDSKERDVYFTVQFNTKGRNYIRGYLVDVIPNINDSLLSTGVRILFEKEVYVK